jgi:hypothetical protein
MTRTLTLVAIGLLFALSATAQAASFASQKPAAKYEDGRTLSDYNIQKE